MFNFDITKENTIKKSNLATNLSLFFKIIITGGLGSGKINALSNLINHQH